jgi:hypothetical protein
MPPHLTVEYRVKEMHSTVEIAFVTEFACK